MQLFLFFSPLLLGMTAAQPGHLQFDLEVARPEISRVIKRDHGSLSVPLINDQIIYLMDIAVGSNRSKHRVQLDTASSDLWIMDQNVKCHRLKVQRPDRTCAKFGVFNTSESRTFKINNALGPFAIQYLDGTGLLGTYARDDIVIGNTIIPDFTFGIVNLTSALDPVLGIGLPQIEASNSNDKLPKMYDNFPMHLRTLGLIKKTIYSLFINHGNATTGSILFGAVDHSKYKGQLQTVPLVETDDLNEISALAIVLDQVTVNGASTNISILNEPISVLLDSSAQLSYFPLAVVDALSSVLDGKIYKPYPIARQVSCSYMTLNLTVSFNFSGAVITGPLSGFISEQLTKVCVLDIRVLESETLILGDNFLSNAYVVYDLEDLEISIAPASFDSGSEDNPKIEVVSSTIPNAVRAALYSQTSMAFSLTSQTVLTGLTTSGQTKKSDAAKAPAHKLVCFFIALITGIFSI